MYAFKLSAMYMLVCMVAATITSAAFAQEFALNMVEVDESESMYRAELILYPVHSNGTQDRDDGESESATDRSHEVTLEFFVQLGQSNSWLLEDDPDRELTDEEIFIRDLFIAKRDATSLEDLRDFMAEDHYRERKDFYSRNEEMRDMQINAFRGFLDIRLLGAIRYGEFYFFLTIIKTPSDTNPTLQGGFAVEKIDGQYLLTSKLSNETTTFFFRTLALRREIYPRLDQFIESGN